MQLTLFMLYLTIQSVQDQALETSHSQLTLHIVQQFWPKEKKISKNKYIYIYIYIYTHTHVGLKKGNKIGLTCRIRLQTKKIRQKSPKKLLK